MAIVTGAATGIGRAIAQKFAANGASVCLLDISRTQAETVAAESGRSALHAIDFDVLTTIGISVHDFCSYPLPGWFFGITGLGENSILV